jgi:thioesterase domain-containing protein
MVPAAFVVLPALPLTSNGKIDHSALPAPDAKRPERERGYVSPRTSLEQYLAGCWQEILGVDRVGVHDDFFSLGGDSVIAAVLALKVQEALGERLYVVAIFQAPTVAGLAAYLRKHYAEAVTRLWGAEAPPDEAASPQLTRPAARLPQPPSSPTPTDVPLAAGPGSLLVAMQPRGDRPPFFCVHPPGGVVFPYAELARHLSPDHPFFAFQGLGLEEGQEPHEAIEDMAECYLVAMRRRQPRGPYLLGGWSLGGTVALEMAQRLLAGGEAVALLGLFDTGAYESVEEYTDEDRAKFIIGLAHVQGLDLSLEEILRLSPAEQLRFIEERTNRAGLMPAGLSPHPLGRILKLYESHVRSSLRYVRRPYPGKITLFRSSVSLQLSRVALGKKTRPQVPDHGWAALAREVEIFKVPGSHRSMVTEPHVTVLADALKGCIDRALGLGGEPR